MKVRVQRYDYTQRKPPFNFITLDEFRCANYSLHDTKLLEFNRRAKEMKADFQFFSKSDAEGYDYDMVVIPWDLKEEYDEFILQQELNRWNLFENEGVKTIELTKEEEELFRFLREVADEHATTVRVAGGWVRDKLLKLPSHDVDIAVDNMSGKAFAELCQKAQGSGNLSVLEARPDQSKHLETAMLKVKAGGGFDVDFAALRKETYADTRIPSVEPGTPEEDAKRRDFTINGMFFNIHTMEVEDYVGGLGHLESGLVTTPMDAKQTFIDDPLRVLRCIRFCAKYDLEPSLAVIDAARDIEVQSAFITKISRERIWAEVVGNKEGEDGWKAGFLTGPGVLMAMDLVVKLGFMDILFSSGCPLNLKPWDTDQNSEHHNLNILMHTLQALKNIDSMPGCSRDWTPEEIAVGNLSIILHDIGKRDPDCCQLKDDGTYSYLGHDDRSVELAEIVLDSMASPKAIKERVLRIIKHHMRFHALEDDPSDKSLRRILRDVGDDWELLLDHSEADACGKVMRGDDLMIQMRRHSGFFKRMTRILESQKNQTSIARPINGHDLMRMGVPKGPKMGEILAALDEVLLESPEISAQEAESFVQSLLEEEEGG